ncbi:GSU2403 family nucleotidyltransferase fold protein [Bradyrhizobium sp.]|uniref:GSU2403 family nucleotidyltransferase fold protein n=1 Tax=Bradyrhizobium sp. TaxID=376 RepID=UPI00260AA6B3|nr:GSU2403 family nucleotidyltransferase fold protein [Bradyrhizobium sp.]
MASPKLVMQTTYAELLDRCANAAFDEAFAEEGAFVAKTVKDRKYWYFQSGTGESRNQKYVGPETLELLDRIAHHREIRDDILERRALVSTLVRSFSLPRPVPEIGKVLNALAKAGVFRLRGVLVGTVAFQTYPAMLGVRLPGARVQTGDVDIAQFKDVSIFVEDSTPPVLDVLREVDSSFRAVPHVLDGRRVTSYAAKNGVRVDFLTPNRGEETGQPQTLPALQTDAQPLRFLDYLIHEPEPAAILHDAGIYVHAPAPARFAIHKLIVSRRRQEGTAKRGKDVQQAEALLRVLAEMRPHDVRQAWDEARARGPRWRQLLDESLADVNGFTRDLMLKTVGAVRSLVPGIDLTFENPPARYDSSRDVVAFTGQAVGKPVTCAISREALDDHFATNELDKEGKVQAVLKNRTKIEQMMRTKYLTWPIEEPDALLIKTSDVSTLIRSGG